MVAKCFEHNHYYVLYCNKGLLINMIVAHKHQYIIIIRLVWGHNGVCVLCVSVPRGRCGQD